MKSAIDAVKKWQLNSANSGQALLEGVEKSDKDQSQAAIAAIPLMQAGLNEAFAKGRVKKGLEKSGRDGHLKGIREKGVQNYGTGVGSDVARTKYTENSGKYDAARQAAKSMPRGSKGSAQNLAKVNATVNALRAIKIGQ